MRSRLQSAAADIANSRAKRTARVSRRRFITGATVAGTGLLTGRPLGARAVVAAQQIVPTSKMYFAQTGHNLAEPFLSAWRLLGGEAVVGPPLSEERYATGAGGVLQTFANLTLVYDPTQDARAQVRIQPLDKAFIEAVAPASARGRVTGCAAFDGACRYFPETGHTISGRIAEYWQAASGQTLFGSPVTESFFDDDGITTQVFERAILGDLGFDGVRPRPVGVMLVEQGGLAADPAFKPAPPSGGTTFLVDASDGLRLREAPGSEAPVVIVLPNNAEFIAASGDHGEWVPGYADGFAGWVSATYLTRPAPLPPLDPARWDPSVWQGAALSETNIRAQPSTTGRIVEELEFGDPVTVREWVAGEEVFEGADLWARVGENRFVYARNVGRNAPVLPIAPPPDAPTWGKWVDIHLTQQLMTAYDGVTPVRTIVVTTGMAGWETPPGLFYINRRVANETMTSGAIGAEQFYKLEDVLFTQYFTDLGHALHFAWWRTPETIGRPGSHGCVNMLLEDSRFMWDWATIGTPILIRQGSTAP